MDMLTTTIVHFAALAGLLLGIASVIDLVILSKEDRGLASLSVIAALFFAAFFFTIPSFNQHFRVEKFCAAVGGQFIDRPYGHTCIYYDLEITEARIVGP